MHLIIWARMTEVLFSKHAARLSWVCFFPTGLQVLHPAGRPRQCIATHVDGQPAERRQTRTQVLLPLIWDQLRPSCSGFAIKANKPQQGHFYPCANQRASSSPMPKLIRWWRLNSFVSQIQIAVVHQRVNTLIPLWACENTEVVFWTWSSTISAVTSITSTVVVVGVNDDAIVYHMQPKYLHARIVETVTQQWLGIWFLYLGQFKVRCHTVVPPSEIYTHLHERLPMTNALSAKWWL